jgi:hypothetical protein
MDFEAAVWVGISLGAPAAAAWAWPRLEGPWRARVETLRPLARGAHAILPAYLALLRGAVLGRDLGLYGPGAGWVAAGLLAAAGGLGAAFAARRWLTPRVHTTHPDSSAGPPPPGSPSRFRRSGPRSGVPVPSPVVALQEEPRWALYRAAGILWVGSSTLGVALGVGLAGLDAFLAAGAWRAESRSRPGSWSPLLRAGFSGALFLMTRSFWLTAAVQIAVLMLLSGASRRESEFVGR